MSYRILSLDGGGVWALIEAKALIALYGPENKAHDVPKESDLGRFTTRQEAPSPDAR
jgi:hypothetical protein